MFSILTHPLRDLVVGLHNAIRDAVVSACESTEINELSSVDREESDDTIYAIDAVSEQFLVEYLKEHVSGDHSVLLIAEGLPPGGIVFPLGVSRTDAKWKLIIDPIDGTRNIMYQKRSAWILTGAAPNLGESTSLSHIEFAVQTEIPLVSQFLSDQVYAVAGKGAVGLRKNRLTGVENPLPLTPSTASTIQHGFSTVSRFFPGARDVLAAIDDEIVQGALGPIVAGKAQCFEDQYISTGGQLYQLMSGRDRFVTDLRPMMDTVLASKGSVLGITCHPYDMCTELIARELGVIVTNVYGQRIDCLLDTQSPVAWAGYANSDIQLQIEPHLLKALSSRGL